MPNYVPGIGPRDARIVLVGDAPGADEDRERQPFVGASGKLLTSMLAQIGVSRNEVYLTNICKVRPPNNDFGSFYLDKRRTEQSEFLKQSVEEVKAEIQSIRPNVIITLGDEPTKLLSGRHGISKWRGSILEVRGLGKIVPTYHPAYILRVYEHRAVVELDLRRGLKESLDAAYKPDPFEFEVQPSYERVMAFLRELRETKRRFSFDIETLSTHVRCLGLSDSSSHAMCIPFIKLASTPVVGTTTLLGLDESTADELSSYWSEDEEYAILSELDLLFSDPLIPKSAQNVPFDSTVLAWDFGFAIRGFWLDTMLAFHTCYPELPKGLDFIASVLTRRPYYSDYEASNDMQTWVYNCNDCIVTYEASTKLEAELRESHMWEYYKFHREPPIWAYTRAQNRGVKVNEEERQRQKKIIQAEIAELEVKIKAFVGDPNFNPSSPKQVQEYLYNKLGLPAQLHKKTKRPTTDKTAMESLARKYPNRKDFFDACRDHSSRETVLSGFHNKPLGPDTRIYTSFNITGTVNGRLSSSEHFLFPASTNLQNIERPPKPTRRCFISDEGWSLVKVDLSQAQFRMVVWLGKIQRLIKVYAKNPKFDVHTWVWSLIYRKPDLLPVDIDGLRYGRDPAGVVKEERDIAKNGVYGGSFKMYYVTAAHTYHLPLDKAKWVLDSFHREVFEIPIWWQAVNAEVNKTRRLKTPFGWSRLFLGRLDEDLYRQAYAAVPQAWEADLVWRAAALCDEIFDPNECQILLQVHDELVFQIRDELVDKYIPLIKKLMEYDTYVEGVEEPLIIPADAKVGKNWLECKERKLEHA